MGMSPDDYRRASGYRRSTDHGLEVAPIGHNGGPPLHAEWATQNPLATGYVFEDMKDPRLAAFLGGGRTSVAGIAVSEPLAYRNSTFFRAVNLIASAIGMLPVHLMREKAGGDTEEAKDHPLYGVLKRRPNAYQTAFEFKSYMQSTALLDGNAFAFVVRDYKDRITALIPLKRGTVEPILGDDFNLTFRYQAPGRGRITLKPEEVFHFRSPISIDGIKGLGLLDVAVQALGIAAQAENAAARTFASGMMAGGALQTDKELGPEAVDRLRQQLEERYSGAQNAGKWLVLEEGLKVAQLIGSLKEQQNLETRKMQAEELSRFTGAPRPLLMFDETSWGTGISTLGQFFVTYCLGAWFVTWEQAVERCLAPAEQGIIFPKFNAGALLRGSLADQAAFFSKALGNTGAWMTADEVRGNFDLNKIDGGDKLPAGGKAPPSDPPADPAPPAPKPPKAPTDG
jgi:HK97 family phage portal protein